MACMTFYASRNNCWGGGGYSWEFLVGVCRLVLQILIRPKHVIFHTRFQISVTCKIHARFETKKAQKPYPLGRHITI